MLDVGLAAGVALVSVAVALYQFRRAASLRQEHRSSRERLEQRTSLAELRRHEAEQQFERTARALHELRVAVGLEGPRAVPRTQLQELARGASLTTVCLADGHGLPHGGCGGLDDIDALAAFGGSLAPLLPRGATLLARDERGVEMGVRSLEVGGDTRVLVVEGQGALPRRAIDRTVLRLDPQPAALPERFEAQLPIDPNAAPLLRGSSVGAAMLLPSRGGLIEDPACGATLERYAGLLEHAADWLRTHSLLDASSVQISDADGTAALLLDGRRRAIVASAAEGIDVLTEQRLAGLLRRRVADPEQEGRAA